MQFKVGNDLSIKIIIGDSTTTLQRQNENIGTVSIADEDLSEVIKILQAIQQLKEISNGKRSISNKIK